MTEIKKLDRQSIENAIRRIDHKPELLSGRKSTHYDLVFKGAKYPPILVLSEANKLKGGDKLTLSDFNNDTNEAFKILDELGFRIIEKNNSSIKESFKKTLKKFLKQAKTDDLRTAHYVDSFNGLKVKVSFGQGNTARIPWISFLHGTQSTSNDIYPVYLYYKDQNLLILAYGISENNKPNKEWDLDNPQKIKDYFEENELGKPHRYGQSYIYEVYDLDKSLDSYSIDEDLLDITSEYIKIMDDYTDEVEPERINLRSIKQSFSKANIIFDENLIDRFVLALLSKPFLILTGLSGSGKTKIAQAFANWIISDKNQVNLVPVGADWTNREPLLGYPNALKEKTYVLPDTGMLQFILRAKNNSELPYFLILDEMNLSHVERYFADFLSAIESQEEIKLHSGSKDWDANGYQIPSTLGIPKNLFIIGTVNIDETTYMFSPKVLDRANVIEFRVSENELDEFLKNPVDIDLNSLYGKGSIMAKSFVELAKNSVDKYSNELKLSSELLNFFRHLSDVGAEFGYRTAYEINRFARLSEELAEDWEFDDIMDAAISQKLLPKLHGSRRKLELVILKLGSLCIVEGDTEELLKKPKEVDTENVKYPISFKKLARMYKALLDNGFTSFAEA